MELKSNCGITIDGVFSVLQRGYFWDCEGDYWVFACCGRQQKRECEADVKRHLGQDGYISPDGAGCVCGHLCGKMSRCNCWRIGKLHNRLKLSISHLFTVSVLGALWLYCCEQCYLPVHVHTCMLLMSSLFIS